MIKHLGFIFVILISPACLAGDFIFDRNQKEVTNEQLAEIIALQLSHIQTLVKNYDKNIASKQQLLSRKIKRPIPAFSLSKKSDVQKNDSYFECRHQLNQSLCDAVEWAAHYYEINLLKDLDAIHQEMCEYHYKGQPLCVEPCIIFRMPEFQCFIKRKITTITGHIELEKEHCCLQYQAQVTCARKKAILGLGVSAGLWTAALAAHASLFFNMPLIAYCFDATAVASLFTAFFYAHQSKEFAKKTIITDDEAVMRLLVKKFLKNSTV